MHRNIEDYEDALKFEGYAVEKAGSVDEMLEKMGVPTESAPDSSPANHFDLYLMDVNLGYPNKRTYEPAACIYAHVKRDVDDGRARFIAVSANIDAVECAKQAGIPCCDKLDLFKTLFES